MTTLYNEHVMWRGIWKTDILFGVYIVLSVVETRIFQTVTFNEHNSISYVLFVKISMYKKSNRQQVRPGNIMDLILLNINHN